MLASTPTKAAAILPLHRLFQYAHDERRQQTAAQQSNQKSDGVIDHRDEEQPAVGGRAAAAKLHSQCTGQAAACHAGGHHAQRITQRKGQRALGYKGCPHQQVLRRGATLLLGEAVREQQAGQRHADGRHHTADHDRRHNVQLVADQRQRAGQVGGLVDGPAIVGGHQRTQHSAHCQNFSFSTDNKYFAYYPYKSDAQKVDPSALNASTFFASKISSLSPASDQSTQNTLLAQDFQVAKGVVASDASTLTFLMEHAMGLAEITLGAKTFDANYRLSNYNDYTWKNKTTFHAYAGIRGYSFYKVEDYRYVALVKPNVTTGFSCGNPADLDAWTEDVLNVKPAANGVAQVKATSKRDPDSYIPYTMEVGDIYYDDGAMTHQSEDLASGKTPIGIVGYTGNDYWTEKGVSGKGGHALVMCLKTIGSNGSPEAALEDFNRYGINGETYKAYIGTGYAWAPSDDDAGRELIDSKDKLVNSYKYSYGSGYTETAALIKKWNTKAAAAYQAQNYNTLPANSPKCTGWFLPTAGQYYAVMTTLGASFSHDWTGIYDGVTSTHPKFGFFSNMTTVTTNINNKLKKVGDLKYTEFFGNINTWAWTSSQLRSTDAVYIDSGIDDPNESGAIGSVRFFYANYKNSALLPPVRPFLAF